MNVTLKAANFLLNFQVVYEKTFHRTLEALGPKTVNIIHDFYIFIKHGMLIT